MAKLHFFYSTMNAGKSTALLQSNYNYHERGMETLLFLPKIDADRNSGKIHSRIGLTADAHSVDLEFNFFNFLSQEKKMNQISIYCSKRIIVFFYYIIPYINVPACFFKL